MLREYNDHNKTSLIMDLFLKLLEISNNTS